MNLPMMINETFILCRSKDRSEKEKAMHQRFEMRIEESLEKLKNSCEKRKYKKETIDRRVGSIMSKNSRSAGLFKVEVVQSEGKTTISWTKDEKWQAWAELNEGCYLLRTNVTDWSAEDLWKAYIQLTEAEAAFRIHKSDLKIRPVLASKTKKWFWPIYLFAFWLMFCGKLYSRWWLALVWAMSQDEYLMNWVKSAWSMWFCRPKKG